MIFDIGTCIEDVVVGGMNLALLGCTFIESRGQGQSEEDLVRLCPKSQLLDPPKKRVKEHVFQNFAVVYIWDAL